MKNKFFLPILLLYSLISCEDKESVRNINYSVFPAGRSFLGLSEIKVTIGDKDYNPERIFDSCGGYWFKIEKTDLPESGSITFSFTRNKEDLTLFNLPETNLQKFLDPSYYIDSDNEVLKTKAAELTENLDNNIEKAKKIQQFVIGHVSLNIYKDSFLDKASTTYELGYGTCMNFSRLYVALCRAAGIPSRSIWGIVYDHDNNNIYDYHHQWAEMMDESGYWHPCDFNYTKTFDLNDIRYLDLIYAAEENTFINNRESAEILLRDLSYYNDYPVTLTSRLGFELAVDNRPESMTVNYIYTY